MSLSRRAFFRGAAALAAVAIAPAVPYVAVLARTHSALLRYSTIDEIVTTTLRNHAHKVADNVAQNNPLMAMLRQRKRQGTILDD